MEKNTAKATTTIDTEQMLETAKQQMQELESLFETFDGTVRKLVAEKPMLLLGGTLVAGYIAGRLLGGRR
jgi:hypothetical protein